MLLKLQMLSILFHSEIADEKKVKKKKLWEMSWLILDWGMLSEFLVW